MYFGVPTTYPPVTAMSFRFDVRHAITQIATRPTFCRSWFRFAHDMPIVFPECYYWTPFLSERSTEQDTEVLRQDPPARPLAKQLAHRFAEAHNSSFDQRKS